MFLAVLMAAAAAARAMGSGDAAVEMVQEVGDGHGCEQKLNQWCPGWKTESKDLCVACCKANLAKLEPNCNLAKAEGKCGGTGPG